MHTFFLYLERLRNIQIVVNDDVVIRTTTAMATTLRRCFMQIARFAFVVYATSFNHLLRLSYVNARHSL